MIHQTTQFSLINANHRKNAKGIFPWIVFAIYFCIFLPSNLMAQNENKNIRSGNNEYENEQFKDAEIDYREALEKNSQNPKALYNLANALYKQGQFKEAADILSGLSSMEIDEKIKADALHNLGNAQIKNEELEAGIEAYKNALRINPEDQDTRHNLALAQQMLQQQQQQQQNQDDQQNEDQQDQQDQQQQDEDEQQQQDEQEQQQQQQDEEQEQEQPLRPDQISPQDAERILEALKKQEQEIQENLEREEKRAQPRGRQKEW